MKVYLATDHAGFAAKEAVKAWLVGEGYVVEDCGAYTLEAGDDYPKYMHVVGRKLAEDVHAGRNARAIIFGASGQGEAMVVNRYPGVRATVYYGEPRELYTEDSGQYRDADQKHLSILAASRAHNNANCLSVGARFMSTEDAVRAVSEWLATPFSLDERHVRRIEQIEHTL
jgi:ribose 5-phosphate isomerase B